MKSETRTRSRGVALTAEGIEALGRASAERWVSLYPDEKLTRLAKSEILGVSETTLVRMFAGKRVDRVSLETAFARAGLALNAEFVSGDPSLPEIETGVAVVGVPTRSRSRRRWLLPATLAIGSLGSIVGWIEYHPVSAPSSLTTTDEYHMVIHSAEQYYQSGDYVQAQSTLESAYMLAARARMQGMIPEAWRLRADIDAGLGKLSDAELHYRKCMAIHLANKEYSAAPPLLEAIGDVQARRKEFSKAKDTLEQAASGFAEFHDQTGVAMALRDLGSVAYETKDLKDADRRFVAALAAVRADPKQEALRIDIRARRALVTSRQSKHEEARRELLHALDYWRARDHVRWIASTKYQLAIAESDAGNVELARSLFRESLGGYEAAHDQSGVDKVTQKLALD